MTVIRASEFECSFRRFGREVAMLGAKYVIHGPLRMGARVDYEPLVVLEALEPPLDISYVVVELAYDDARMR